MKKITLLALMFALTTSLYAGFGSESKDKTKTINYEGKDYQFVIGTASKTGSYFRAGKKLTSQLLHKLAVAATTDGSSQNMDLLRDGHINVAFVQSDEYNRWMTKNNGSSSDYTVIETPRVEHVQLIMRNGGDEDDLQSKGKKVLVGFRKSGGASSWLNMCLLESGYSKADIITGPIDIVALNQLKNGKIDAIIKTSHLDPSDEFVQRVQKMKEISFVDLDDGDLNDEVTVNGKSEPIYNFVTIKTEGGWFAKDIETIAVKVYVVISNKNTSRKQRTKVAEVVDFYKSSLFKR